MPLYVASLDQSTTSTKFCIYQTDGKLLDKQIIMHTQFTPHEGWLEHDPMEILQNTHKAIQTVIHRLKQSHLHQEFDRSMILGLGICNQRQTVVCWDQTGRPLYNAIVWCDSRTKQICQAFKTNHGSYKKITGLPVSEYFTLFKIMWLIDNVPEVKQKMESGKIKFGTIDTWLIYNLTGKYATDSSNASRTYLCNLKGEWDQQLMKIINIKRENLPEIVGSFLNIGQINDGPIKGISVCCILGDQQSSALAHGIQKDQMKITYGTGCFLLSNIGNQPQINQAFVTTILSKNVETLHYAYEASVECGGGTLNWALRAGLFQNYAQLNNLQHLTNQQLFFYPSFGSIYAPYWKSSSIKGTFSGLNFNTTKQNILFAILESITFRLYDNIKLEEFKKVQQIFVDGGMTVNRDFMQLQADTFNKKVVVSELDTCWGVAKGVLMNKNIDMNLVKSESEQFVPNRERHNKIMQRYHRWSQQRNKIYGWNNLN